MGEQTEHKEAMLLADLRQGSVQAFKQIFDGFDPSKYEAEVKERWGQTDAYKESIRRTQGYTPEDWKRFGEEQASIYSDGFAALQAGQAPDSEQK